MRRAAILRLKTSLPESLSEVWARLARRIRYHAAPLLIVLVVAIGAQIIVLAQGPNIVRQPDTNSYLNVANWLLRNIVTPNKVRTQGYPLFLAEIFWLTRSQNLINVAHAQAALIILSAVEIYALVFIITSRRWIGALAAALVGGNLYLANWSRIILSEPLTTWLLISVMLCFAVYLRRPSYSALALLVALVVASVFTRPQMVYLPTILLAVLFFRALRQARRKDWLRALLRLWPVTAGMVGVYALLALYMFTFMMRYGQFTTTRVTNINLLGVAMRDHALYGMPYNGAGPQYAKLRADLEATKGFNVFVFVDSHRQYDAQVGQFYGTFATQVLRAHPDYVARGTYDAFLQTTSWSAIPFYPAAIPLAPSWLLNISRDISLSYACLPLLLLVSLIAVWRSPHSLQANVLAALMLVVFSHIFMGAAADFGAFARLRMPVDWAMLAVALLAIIELAGGAGVHLFRDVGVQLFAGPDVHPFRGASAKVGVAAPHLTEEALQPAPALQPSTASRSPAAGGGHDMVD